MFAHPKCSARVVDANEISLNNSETRVFRNMYLGCDEDFLLARPLTHGLRGKNETSYLSVRCLYHCV